MSIPSKELIILSVIGFVLSLIIHLITIFNLYQVPNAVIIILTTGILLVWLQSSKNLKIIHKAYPDQHPWKTVFTLCSNWIKYIFYFFIIYAILNFSLKMSFGNGDEYLNFDVSQNKLSGLSGFWMAFYLLGLIFGYALQIHLNKTTIKSNEN